MGRASAFTPADRRKMRLPQVRTKPYVHVRNVRPADGQVDGRSRRSCTHTRQRHAGADGCEKCMALEV